jgi:glycosyltransferase involved in cell wall biosynthesis
MPDPAPLDALPKVRGVGTCCVLIPYYEGGEELILTIDSINDSADVDVLVVDDGSRVKTAEEMLETYETSREVTVVTLPRNEGIARALNAGLQKIGHRYEYVARLDCGDRCVGERLSRQLRFMDENPWCALVGSWVDFRTPRGARMYTVRHPSEHEAIRRRMFVNCAFTHPSVVMRSNVFDKVGTYPVNRPAAEDHALFFRIVREYRTANIPAVLTSCLLDSGGISNQRRRAQLISRIRIILDNFEWNAFAIYGLCRATFQLLTPRSFTVFLRGFGEVLQARKFGWHTRRDHGT